MRMRRKTAERVGESEREERGPRLRSGVIYRRGYWHPSI